MSSLPLSGAIVDNDNAVDDQVLDCNDNYYPMQPMPNVDTVWTPPRSIPSEVPTGPTAAVVSVG